MRERLKSEVDALRGEIAALMQAAVQAGSEAIAESHEQVVIAGERNLLAVQDFSSDMGSLRKLFDLFEQKTQLMRLLEVSSRAEGVRIYIGGESLVVPLRGAVGRLGAVRGRRPGRRHARRDRADAHGLRPHDPDRRHHVAAGDATRCRRSSAGPGDGGHGQRSRVRSCRTGRFPCRAVLGSIAFRTMEKWE